MEWTGVIAIDGPAGAGKSTAARLVASKLGINYLDTGALYRALAWFLDSVSVPPLEGEKLSRALYDVNVETDGHSVKVNGEDVSRYIRTPAVDKIASLYSALPSVREKLLDIQRGHALKGALVADGRDMGTVVFPFAPVKIFLTARAEVRARRRYEELRSRGVDVDYNEILRQIHRRDENDEKRALSPLKQAADAILLDTSLLNVEQVADKIADIAKKVLHD